LRENAKPAAAGTVGEWLETWLSLIKPGAAPKTYQFNEWRVKKWLKPLLGAVRLRDLTTLSVATTLAELKGSESERHKAGRVLRQALRAAVAHGQIPVSPMADLTIPKPKPKEKRAMTPTELAALVAAADVLNRGFVYRLWADAGLRPGELLALTWDRIDLEAGTVEVRHNLETLTNTLKEPKTKGSRRTIKLAASTVDALRAARPVTGGVVVADSRGGHCWQSNYLRDEFADVKKAARLPWLQPYTMRHTMATLLLRAGVPIKVVSERMGHADVATTLRTYAHVLEGDQCRAAATMGSLLDAPKPA
jgi:integrase